jgi:hypothetical protein
MRNLALTLLLSAVPAAAQGDAAAEPAAQISTAAAQQNKYSPEIQETARTLAILLEHGAGVKPEKMEALAAELKKFNNRVKDTLGPEILAAAAAKEKETEDRALAAAAKKELQNLRQRLQARYAEQGGVYPAEPASLEGGLPALHLPGHAPSAAARVIDSKKHDADAVKAVSDSGGWLYFSAPGSANYGMLLIDCSHKDAGGTEFYKY